MARCDSRTDERATMAGGKPEHKPMTSFSMARQRPQVTDKLLFFSEHVTQPISTAPQYMLLLSNIPLGLGADQIHDTFELFGPILYCRMLLNVAPKEDRQNGFSSDCCVIAYQNPTSVATALAYNELIILSQPVYLHAVTENGIGTARVPSPEIAPVSPNAGALNLAELETKFEGEKEIERPNDRNTSSSQRAQTGGCAKVGSVSSPDALVAPAEKTPVADVECSENAMVGIHETKESGEGTKEQAFAHPAHSQGEKRPAEGLSVTSGKNAPSPSRSKGDHLVRKKPDKEPSLVAVGSASASDKKKKKKKPAQTAAGASKASPAMVKAAKSSSGSASAAKAKTATAATSSSKSPSPPPTTIKSAGMAKSILPANKPARDKKKPSVKARPVAAKSHAAAATSPAPPKEGKHRGVAAAGKKAAIKVSSLKERRRASPVGTERPEPVSMKTESRQRTVSFDAPVMPHKGQENRKGVKKKKAPVAAAAPTFPPKSPRSFFTKTRPGKSPEVLQLSGTKSTKQQQPPPAPTVRQKSVSKSAPAAKKSVSPTPKAEPRDVLTNAARKKKTTAPVAPSETSTNAARKKKTTLPVAPSEKSKPAQKKKTGAAAPSPEKAAAALAGPLVFGDSVDTSFVPSGRFVSGNSEVNQFGRGERQAHHGTLHGEEQLVHGKVGKRKGRKVFIF